MQKKLIELTAINFLEARRHRFDVSDSSQRTAMWHGAIKYVRRFFMISHGRVIQALDEYDPNRIGLLPPHVELHDSVATTRSTAHNKIAIPPEAIVAAKAHVASVIGDGSTVTWIELTRYLQAKDFVGEHVSVDTVRRRLIANGMGVLKTRTRPAIDMSTPYWQRQRERFVLQIAHAWAEEAAGRAIVVATDESFLHLHHHRRITVCDLNDPKQVAPERRAKPRAIVPIGSGKGPMHIVCHAMHSGGLLHERDAEGGYRRDSKAMSTEVIYPAGKGSEKNDRDDYHSKWNGHSFILWMKRQLMPTFQRLFGTEKAMFLLIDNSRNHSRRPPSYVKASASKSELSKLLQQHGIHSITVDRGERVVGAIRAAPGRGGRPGTAYQPAHSVRDIKTFASSQWHVRAPEGPSAEELQLRVRQLYADRPELSASILETLFANGV
jgi:hypothetical protein